MSKAHKIGLAISVACVFLLYLPSVSFDFVNWDDQIHLFENPLIVGHEPSSIYDYLAVPTHGYPIPLAILTYKIEYFFVGLSPWLYHLTNVILHSFICLFVFLVGCELGLGFVGGLVATLFFGLHPGIVEVVAWVTSRKTLLSALVFLIAALYFLRSFRKKGTCSGTSIAGFTLLGFLCKPTAIFLPPILFSWEFLLKRTQILKRFLAYLPAAIIAFIMLVVAILQADRLNAFEHKASFSDWFNEVWYAFGFNLDLMTFIKSPAVIHNFDHRPPDFEFFVNCIPLFWIVIGFALYRLFPKSQQIMKFSWVWFFLALLPACGFFPTSRYLADSYIYYSLMGLAWILGSVFENIFLYLKNRAQKLVAIGAMASLYSFMIGATLNYLPTWKNGIILWQSLEEKHPDFMVYCKMVGNAYTLWHQEEKAIAQYQKCADLFPEESFDKGIGIALFRLNRFDDSKPYITRALQRDPSDQELWSFARILKKMDELDRH